MLRIINLNNSKTWFSVYNNAYFVNWWISYFVKVPYLLKQLKCINKKSISYKYIENNTDLYAKIY